MESREERIRELAYKIYLTRQHHGIPGNDKTDYYEAEKKVDRLYEVEKIWTLKPRTELI